MAALSNTLAYLRDCHEGAAREGDEDVSGTCRELDGLCRLVETGDLSPPLERLLRLDQSSASGGGTWGGTAPLSLSHEQQKAVRAAATQALSLLVGPPGTGKSYTLAVVALEHVLQGETVLLCSRRAEALRATEKQLRGLCEGMIPLVGGENRGECARWITDLIDGVASLGSARNGSHAESRRELDELDARITALRETADRGVHLETSWGRLTADSSAFGPGGFLRALQRTAAGWRLRCHAPLESVVSEYQHLVTRRSDVTAELATSTLRGRLELALVDDRDTIRRLLDALRALDRPDEAAGSDSTDTPPNAEALLRALPLWVLPFSALPRLVPLTKGLFDLVLVDEGAQCDLASPLPALFRARRAMVAGDSRQLRHLSFLADERQSALAHRHDVDVSMTELLDYRRRSLLDLVEDQCVDPDRVVQLSEHYRCHPAIISFSDRVFYGGTLRIMTHHPENLREPGLELRRVEGCRRPDGHNPEEVDAVVEETLRWVGNETLVDDARCHSIGVLSPFRAQANRIAAELEAVLPRRVAERHRILIGTPHDFQGRERDVVCISFAVDASSSSGALRYLNREDVFNVAITRARCAQYVFCSSEPDGFPPDSLIHRYLKSIAGETQGSEIDGSDRLTRFSDDEFIREVRDALAGDGYATWVGWPVAGVNVDLVIEARERYLAIDLVGRTGASAPALPLDRYRMLARAGLQLVPLSYSQWCRDRAGCLKALRARIEARSESISI